MTGGVHPVFIISVVALVAVALLRGLGRWSTGGAKGAALSAFRVLVYGGFILFLLFAALLALYYARGGH